MIREQLICFDLGYQVENLTDFRDRLVDMFGIGGTVKHDRSGEVKDFDVLMEYGTLRLDSSRKVLELNMDSSDYGTIISSEDIQTLYKKLRDSEIITGNKPWFLEKRNVYEI
ncbi:MAG: hypothetical protein K2M91_01130 [Lachnospiraceae bacterium]|nr:hypothetical protein [Lachnospiraceae bacterium]